MQLGHERFVGQIAVLDRKNEAPPERSEFSVNRAVGSALLFAVFNVLVYNTVDNFRSGILPKERTEMSIYAPRKHVAVLASPVIVPGDELHQVFKRCGPLPWLIKQPLCGLRLSRF